MSTVQKKRTLFQAVGLLAFGFGLAGFSAIPVRADTLSEPGKIAVWSAPGCGCCEGWVDHMTKAGFAVTVHRSDDIMAIKEAQGVPEAVQSCHTAVIDGYVVEGHVPADLVLRMLAERPRAKGIAAPGMPLGSPGMGDGPHPPYDVVLFGTPTGITPFAQR